VRKTRVVAVVGSFGKSTATRAVAAALAAPGLKSMTANAWTSVALAVLRIRPWQRHAAIEVGIGGRGQMEQYARLLRPDLTVVTSIGSEHNGSLGSLDVTRAEKARMISAMSASGIAVLNGDDPNVLWMKAQAPGRVILFGFGAGCEVRAERVRLDWPHGTRLWAAGTSAHRAELGYRVLALLGVLAAALIVARRTRNAAAVALLGWSPLVALHFAGGGHSDAWMIALLVIFGFLLGRSPGQPEALPQQLVAQPDLGSLPDGRCARDGHAHTDPPTLFVKCLRRSPN